MNFNESVDKWIVMWVHDFNENELMMRNELGEMISLNLVGKMNPRDAVKEGRTEVFQMYAVVNDPSRQSICYLDVNSLYPYVMAHTEFPVGHPEIWRGDYSCCNLLSDLKPRNVPFIGVCLVRVLAPRGLMVPYLPHKIDGKLMFFMCRECSLRGAIQHRPCTHTELERSLVDTYTSIDMYTAIRLGYDVVEYFELWHYPQGGSKFFKEFILNIVRRKIDCSGFPPMCCTREEKQHYVEELST